jgi:hypothetical protein
VKEVKKAAKKAKTFEIQKAVKKVKGYRYDSNAKADDRNPADSFATENNWIRIKR